jgi:uncharacterized membrane protein HdeD (DUF308 family)
LEEGWIMHDTMYVEWEPAWWAILLEGIAAIILGVLLVMSPARTLFALIVFLGAYWVVRGIIGLIDAFRVQGEHRGWRAFAAIVSVLAGLFVLAYPLASTFVVPFVYVLVIGFGALFSGIMLIVYGSRYHTGAGVVLGVLDVIFGLIVIASPYVAVLALPYVLGIFAIIEGLILVVQSFSLRSHQHTMGHMAPA